MTIEALALNVSLAVGVTVNIDFTIRGEIMIDHEGNVNERVKEYFKSLKLVELEYDEECNTTFYIFDK